MREELDILGLSARRFLEHHLPALDDQWWTSLVLPSLSFQQRQIQQERGWNSLDQLDVAALLRVEGPP